MNFQNILMSMVLANSLPAGERMVAEKLGNSADCASFLEAALMSDAVLVVGTGFPEWLTQLLIQQREVRFTLFPVPAVGMMSTSPAETSKHTSLTICSLLNKVYERGNHRVKGVVSLFLGVSRGNGAMIWLLRNLDFVHFPLSSMSLVTSLSFADSFTMRPRLRSIRKTRVIESTSKTPSQLISEALTLLDEQGDSGSNYMGEIVNLALAIVPLAYHATMQGA